ncbi:hypothetical protein BCU68_08745 [Vibrio sp. 10N.286.49.B3]|uniref:hypothetical protein n=1 Tax=Vibrio sp. 10N.286.49.B3 TaxID=1880855 RepID=UPI000C84EB3F|nr:hypothetical protein [Vibrio sp. 10N.286.49.B3]PMH46150.1 hypothetical protein BCU68_08745 [Vibrio sp. 10N.286.49.B3]
MSYLNLLLDDEAQQLVQDIISELNQDNGWFQMTTRVAAQIDNELKEQGYIGNVTWFSETDFIEQDIEYR